LQTLNNAASESLYLALWVKINEQQDHHPIYHLVKMYDVTMLFKPSSIKDYKDLSSIFMQNSGIKSYR